MDNSPAPKRPAPLFAGPEVRISAKNFGPIESGAIDLRPLNVFVGPSNTGKTYFAVLIYALHRVLGGFPRLPAIYREFGWYHRREGDIDVQWDEVRRVAAKLDAEDRTLLLSDMPKALREAMRSSFTNAEAYPKALNVELRACFDIASIDGLIRGPSQEYPGEIRLDIKEKNESLWDIRANITESNFDFRGTISDIDLFPKDLLDADSSYRDTFRIFQQRVDSAEIREGKNAKLAPMAPFMRLTLLSTDSLARLLSPARGDILYLPAARSGIVQSHGVIVSSIVTRSTRAGLEPFVESSMFSRMVADFMQRLILYGERLPDDEPSTPSIELVRAHKETMKNIADTLERQTLCGRIETLRSTKVGHPEFVFGSEQAGHNIRMSRASSMVSELAPVILFIRGYLARGDTMILEEPEAHLHPAAQTEMAVALARLARAGVRVVVTTHSDWLLQQIGNLIREGELAETGDEAAPASDAALRPRDVGVWLFDRNGSGGGSTVREVQFDRIDGVQPPDYEDVAERLYNRSAELQDRLEAKRPRQKRT